MEDKNEQYAYSANGNADTWHDTIKAVIENLYCDENFNASPGEKITIYRGKKISYTHADFADNVGEAVQEHFQETAHDYGREYSEDYLHDMTLDHHNELIKLIVKFLNKNCEQPYFWTVDNPEPYVITWPGNERT